MSRRLLARVAAIAVFCPIAASHAHHSFSAEFDRDKPIKVTGTVTKFQWTNPHGFLEVDYVGAGGKMKHYTLELTSINMLQRAGWTSRSIKAGEKVVAIAAPLLSGEPGGLLLEVKLADGRTLTSPVPAAGTFKRTPGKELQ